MLTEAVKIASTPTQQEQKFTDYKPVPKGQPKKWSVGKSASLDEMLNMTAKTMSGEDARNFTNAGQVSKPNFASSMGAQMGMTENAGPMPGIDISKLDFVSKAKQVYDASIQKDKNRGL